MAETHENIDYNNVVDKLLETFGEVLSRDVMLTIVESYEGDLDESANAVMNITMDGNCINHSTSGNGPTPNNMYPFTPNNHYVQPVIRHPHMVHFYHPNGFNRPMTRPPLLQQPHLSYSAAFHQMPPRMINHTSRPIIKSENKNVYKRSIIKNDCKNGTLNNATSSELQNILKHHENGNRTLIILRGAPGSGKTFLAQRIIDTIYNKTKHNYAMHIYGTDQYFIKRGAYEFCGQKLPEAHDWNQRRANTAMKQGISPVIIDNTNKEMWEMKPYVEIGVRYGYIIEVLEPDTPWAKKAQILFKKNLHNVPLASIERMLQNFQPNVTGSKLLHYLSIQYNPTMTPPVLRSVPPYNGGTSEEMGSTNIQKKYVPGHINKNVCANDFNAEKKVSGITYATHLNGYPTKEGSPTSSISICQEEKDNSELLSLQNDETKKIQNAMKISMPSKEGEVNQEILSDETTPQNDSLNEDALLDVAAGISIDIESEKENTFQIQEPNEIHTDVSMKTLEALDKVEIEWESGEKCQEEFAKKKNKYNSLSEILQPFDAKPQRIKPIKVEGIDNVLNNNLQNCQDWSKINMFLPPWSVENQDQKSTTEISTTSSAEKISSYTCLEIGDTDISDTKNPHKIISAVPRDINEFHLPIKNIKIPDQWMLDKGTSTHDNQLLSPAKRCKNENEHFKVFSKLFKNVDVDILKDIFDKCNGDINWAVDIVLDDMASENVNNIMDNINTPMSEMDVPVLDCDCLSAYNIIPDRLEAALPENQDKESDSKEKETQSSNNLKKNKKESTLSEASLELKRQIEENIVIPDNHYSEHCLKIRKIRRGETDTQDNLNAEDKINNQPSTSTEYRTADSEGTAYNDNNLPSTSKMCTESESSGSACASFDEEGEKTVNVCIGNEFVRKLDELYGGQTAECLSFLNPTVNIPMSILDIINALWIESLTDQLQESSKQSQIMLEQDEELARLLAAKEEELSLLGKEPEIPDFKEIMDMDYALSIYQRDVAEWRNNLPDDLAAKLSREKLYNLFPSVSPEVLSELLLAHENNFHLTVEVLLTSTGQTDILKMDNGVNKFIVDKEMERQERILQEERKALSEVEWPLLPKNEKIDMNTVYQLREYADKHLRIRNENYNKANEYFNRGMTQVSTYYLELASFHKTRFEQTSSMAAASLIQIHAANSSNNATIDLHYLRVREAKEALDLFLDTHIQKLKELQSRSSNVKSHNLFFITGRGLHSQGKPKIKPAVKKRLMERGLTCFEKNPGLLSAKVCADDKLSHQIA